jgi:hypothetical protein
VADCGDGGVKDQGGAEAGEDAESEEEVPVFLDGELSNAEGIGERWS